MRNLSRAATKALLDAGAFFSRPHGENARMIMNRDGASVEMLKKSQRDLRPQQHHEPGEAVLLVVTWPPRKVLEGYGRSEMALEEYAGDMNMCCRCSTCKFIPLQMDKGLQVRERLSEHLPVQLPFLLRGGPPEPGRQRTAERDSTTHLGTSRASTTVRCAAPATSPASTVWTWRCSSLSRKCVSERSRTARSHPALEKVVARMRATGSMVPTEGVKRGDWAKGLGLKDASREKVDVLYHVGCLTSFDKDMQRLATATAKVLTAAASTSVSPATPRPVAGGGHTRWVTRTTSWPRRPRAWRSSGRAGRRRWSPAAPRATKPSQSCTTASG